MHLSFDCLTLDGFGHIYATVLVHLENLRSDVISHDLHFLALLCVQKLTVVLGSTQQITQRASIDATSLEVLALSILVLQHCMGIHDD